MSNDNKHPNETVISVDDIQLSNVRSFDLPEGVIDRARTCHAVITDMCGMSESKFIDCLRADSDPESEMQVWEAIAGAFQAYCNENPSATPEQQKQVFIKLLKESMSG